jgi:hypothetical protein
MADPETCISEIVILENIAMFRGRKSVPTDQVSKLPCSFIILDLVIGLVRETEGMCRNRVFMVNDL